MALNRVEAILEKALEAATAGQKALRAALDQLPAAIYVTDCDGVITISTRAASILPGGARRSGKIVGA